MLHPVVSGIIYVLETLIYYVFFCRIGKRKFSAWKCLLIGFGLFELGSMINLLGNNSFFLNTIVTIGIVAVYGCLFFEISIKVAFLYSLILNVANYAMELVAIFGFSAWLKIPMSEYQNDLAILFIETLACKTPHFLICLLLANLVVGDKVQKIPLSLFAYPVCVMTCLFAFSYMCASGIVEQRGEILLATTSGMLLISLIFLFNTFQDEVEKDVLFARTQAENNHLKTEKEYYDVLEKQNQNLMMYAHDAKKHLNAIRELSKDERIDEYVTRLFGELSSYTQVCHSGNKMLDIMLNRYILNSELKGITFNFDVKECPLLGLDDLDLVAILGNLMDNALTAASQSAEKKVWLTTSIRNTYNVIVLKNSCDTPPQIQGEKLLSTKENPRYHGYGIERAKRAAKKYQGDLHWTYNKEQNLFTMTVILQLHTKNP